MPCGGAEGLQTLELLSYVRGFHAYRDTWEPRIGEQHNHSDANAFYPFSKNVLLLIMYQ